MCNFKNLLLWLSWSLRIGVMEMYQSLFQKIVLCIYLFWKLRICLWQGDACFFLVLPFKKFSSTSPCFTFNKTSGAMRPKNDVNFIIRLKVLCWACIQLSYEVYSPQKLNQWATTGRWEYTKNSSWGRVLHRNTKIDYIVLYDRSYLLIPLNKSMVLKWSFIRDTKIWWNLLEKKCVQKKKKKKETALQASNVCISFSSQRLYFI